MKNVEIVALIYTRVSTHQQETDGSGNKSQEIRCRELADREGYSVDKVFTDTFTGAGDFMKRPAMKEMVEYIDHHPYKKFVVIFDDLKRLSRDTKAYLELRLAFKSRNVILKCLNFNFEDSPEGEFKESKTRDRSHKNRELGFWMATTLSGLLSDTNKKKLLVTASSPFLPMLLNLSKSL